MIESANTYKPDYAIIPGWILEEHLEARGLSQKTFAKYCGRSSKLISNIIAGIAPIEPKTALEFERVLGMDASIWLNIEASYRLFLAKEKEQTELKKNIQWAKSFPIRDLKKLGFIPQDAKNERLVSFLLSFFGLGSTQVWQEKVLNSESSLHFRKQNGKKLSLAALSAWLRMVEIEDFHQECEPYNRARFMDSLKKIREMTMLSSQKFYPEMINLCNKSGVAFMVLPQLDGIPISGIAKWSAPNRAIIALTLRFKTNDHFWFSFFHEAAHILLHGKKDLFIDWLENKDRSKIEIEADEWASNLLISKNKFMEISIKSIDYKTILDFANSINIHPGIVVGRLQHEGLLDWHHFNKLKSKFELIQTSGTETNHL